MELAGSRETTKAVDAQSIPLKYVAWTTIDQGVLNTAFALLVGTSFGGLPLDTLKCTPQGGGVWNCEALFSLRVPAPPENNDDTEALGIAYAIDLSAGQIHITQSLETVSRVAGGSGMSSSIAGFVSPNNGQVPTTADIGQTITITGGTGWNPGTYTITGIVVSPPAWQVNPSPATGLYPASGGATGGEFSTSAGVPNYQQAIGVTKDSVAGTDIFAPKFEFSITVKTYPVTLDFIRTLRNASAKTNASPWKGFAAGELLYLGVTGQAQPNDFWTLTHKFAAGENKTDIPVSPGIRVDKKAWEYLWCVYQFAGSNGGVVQVPQAAYVEKVYNETNFDLLRLDPPVADFTASPIGGMHPLGVTFTDLSTGTPLTWLWTFGDGGVSTVRNPSHIYLIPGVYTVSLDVSNGAGQSFQTRFNFITVS